MLAARGPRCAFPTSRRRHADRPHDAARAPVVVTPGPFVYGAGTTLAELLSAITRTGHPTAEAVADDSRTRRAARRGHASTSCSACLTAWLVVLTGTTCSLATSIRT